MTPSTGFAHFIMQADLLSHLILGLLVLASVTSWTIIIVKTLALARQTQHSRQFLELFWNAASLEDVAQAMHARGVTDPYSNLVHHGFTAVATLRGESSEPRGLVAAVSPDEFVSRALRRSIEEDKNRLERGQTLLASIASSAPFVGLFGTVWGIYHALMAIGLSGSAALDKVAGPVGEALIMTGIGLAVAIPASLAYNFFTRAIRNRLTGLSAFAHDVHALLTMGVKAHRNPDARTSSERMLNLVQHNGTQG